MLSLRAQKLFNEHKKDYIPLALDGSIKSGEILVFAPHPDDETIGCGGTIALHRARNDQVKVIIVTDGSLG